MTHEEIIQMTGLKHVGADKKLKGRGIVLGFPAEAVPDKKNVNLYLFTESEVTKQQKNKLAQKFETSVATFHTQESSFSDWKIGGVLMVVVWFSKEEPEAAYEQLLQSLGPALEEVGIQPAANCPFCDKPDGDAVTKLEERLVLTHMDCLQHWQEEQSEKAEHNRYNQSSMRGIIGGLIGGVVGALPTLGALYFFDFFVGILFALIPLSIYYGWKLFGGRLSNLTTAFTIFYTIVVALIVEIVDSWLILREVFPELEITLLRTIDVYLDPYLFREMFMRSTVTALVFAAIGIWIAWKQIRKTDKSDVEYATTALDEAVRV